MADFLLITDNSLESLAVSTLLTGSGHNITPIKLETLRKDSAPARLAALNIIDIDSLGDKSATVTDEIRGMSGNTPLVWLSSNKDDRNIRYAAIAVGASGCLSKTDIDQIVPALERAAGGEILHSKELLVSFINKAGPMQIFAPLTEREREILAMLQCGLTNKEIASSLHLSVETIKHHISSIKAALNLKHRRQFALGARRETV